VQSYDLARPAASVDSANVRVAAAPPSTIRRRVCRRPAVPRVHYPLSTACRRREVLAAGSEAVVFSKRVRHSHGERNALGIDGLGLQVEGRRKRGNGRESEHIDASGRGKGRVEDI